MTNSDFDLITSIVIPIVGVALVLLLIYGAFWLIGNAPGTLATFHDLEEKGTFVCVSRWEWKNVNYQKACFEWPFKE